MFIIVNSISKFSCIPIMLYIWGAHDEDCDVYQQISCFKNDILICLQKNILFCSAAEKQQVLSNSLILCKDIMIYNWLVFSLTYIVIYVLFNEQRATSNDSTEEEHIASR